MTLQTEIDNASIAGGGTVLFKPGDPQPTEQIILRRGVRLQGVGKICYDYHVPGPVKGSILNVGAWSSGPGSSGDPAKAAIRAEGGTSVDGIVFNYPNQDVNAAVPTEYGASIHCSDPGINEYECSITNNYFFKSYIAVDTRRGASIGGLSNFVMTGNLGCPIKSALVIDGVTDWQNISGNNWNSGFSAPGLRTGLVSWSSSNGICYQLGGNDWIKIDTDQVFGYRHAALITGGVGYAGGGPYSFDNCQFDGCWHAIECNGTIGHPVQINGCNFAPYNFITGDPGCAFTSYGNSLAGLQFNDNHMFGPALFMVYIGGGGARDVQILGNSANVSQKSSGPAFVVQNANGIQIDNNIVHGFASVCNTGGSSNIQIGSNIGPA